MKLRYNPTHQQTRMKAIKSNTLDRILSLAEITLVLDPKEAAIPYGPFPDLSRYGGKPDTPPSDNFHFYPDSDDNGNQRSAVMELKEKPEEKEEFHVYKGVPYEDCNE